MQAGNIENIIEKIEELKHARERINRALDAALDDLIQVMGKKEEGTITAMTLNYQVSLRFALNRQIDKEKFDQIKDYIPPQIVERLISFEPKIVMHELRFLQQNKPSIYEAVCDFVIAKPARPTLTYKRTEESNGN